MQDTAATRTLGRERSNILLRMEVGGAINRVQMVHINSKQCFTTHSDKLVVLELQYRTKTSMCNAISFQDQPQEISWTAQEKGKASGEEHNQKMSAFCSLSISKPVRGHAPIVSIVSTVVVLLDNLSCGVLLEGRLDAMIRLIMKG